MTKEKSRWNQPLVVAIVAAILGAVLGAVLTPWVASNFTPAFPRMIADFTVKDGVLKFDSFPNCTRISASAAGRDLGRINLLYININSGGPYRLFVQFSYQVTVTSGEHWFSELTERNFTGLSDGGPYRVETIFSQLPGQNSARVVIYLSTQLWNGTQLLSNPLAVASC